MFSPASPPRSARALPADADAGDVQLLAGRLLIGARQHVAGNDADTRQRRRRPAHEFTPRHASLSYPAFPSLLVRQSLVVRNGITLSKLSPL